MWNLKVILIALTTFPLTAAPPQLIVPIYQSGVIGQITSGRQNGWFATLTAGPNPAIQIWALPDALHQRTFPANDTRAIAAHPSATTIE